MAWYTEGTKHFPSNGTVLADTGAKPTGQYTVSLVMSSTLPGTLTFERRNSSDSSTLQSQTFKVLANETWGGVFGTAVIDDDERFRLITSGLTLADVTASIFVS